MKLFYQWIGKKHACLICEIQLQFIGDISKKLLTSLGGAIT